MLQTCRLIHLSVCINVVAVGDFIPSPPPAPTLTGLTGADEVEEDEDVEVDSPAA